MLTNDLKNGAIVQLRNGWRAEIMDNKKGNIRLANVHGIVTEIGSVYSHDIAFVFIDGAPVRIEHTKAQIKLRKTVEGIF